MIILAGKHILLAFPLITMIIFSGCSQTVESTEDETLIESRRSTGEIQTLDDLIEESHSIIVGRVESVEKFSGSTNTYVVSVIKDLKGNMESQYIDVYEFNHLIEDEKEYVFFLSYWESPLYPKAVYSTILDSAFEVISGKVVGNGDYIKGENFSEYIEYIMSSPGIKTNNKPDYEIVEKAESLEELMNLSDHILHIQPFESHLENKYVKSLMVNIVETYKGHFNSTYPLTLPPAVKTGKEYLVFLKGEDYELATRDGSVISKDDAQWEEAIEILNQNK